MTGDEMKNQPTYDDARLILELYDLRREPRLREARKWIAGIPSFASREEWLAVCPPGSEENASFRMVVTYWDMAASFVATGVLNAELFYRANNMEILFIWEKIKRVVPEFRAVARNPIQYRHIEQVATGFIEYINANAPEAYETLSANIAKIGRK
jgi:hypothetical protein